MTPLIVDDDYHARQGINDGARRQLKAFGERLN
jgi:hypothetical protein